jgi:hypothetical protein
VKISGHKTASVYRRYRIVEEQDIAAAWVRTQAARPPRPRRRLPPPARVRTIAGTGRGVGRSRLLTPRYCSASVVRPAGIEPAAYGFEGHAPDGTTGRDRTASSSIRELKSRVSGGWRPVRTGAVRWFRASRGQVTDRRLARASAAEAPEADTDYPRRDPRRGGGSPPREPQLPQDRVRDSIPWHRGHRGGGYRRLGRVAFSVEQPHQSGIRRVSGRRPPGAPEVARAPGASARPRGHRSSWQRGA